MEIRLLRADEIECRVASVNEKGVTLLLYKDARVDMKILDETVGPYNWKRSHQSIDGNLYCTVEVFDPEKGEWINKQDVGVSGYTEKEKSQASDSFKRSCFLWGIGRELYTAPFIWIPADRLSIAKRNESYYCSSKFKVDSIEYSKDREITGVTIINDKGEQIYRYQKKNPVKDQPPVIKSISKAKKDKLHKEMERTGVTMEDISARYHISGEADITEEILSSLMRALSRTETRVA